MDIHGTSWARRRIVVALSVAATSACSLLYGPEASELAAGMAVDSGALDAETSTTRLDAEPDADDAAPARFCEPVADAGPFRVCEDYDGPRTTSWTTDKLRGDVVITPDAGYGGSTALVATLLPVAQNEGSYAHETSTFAGRPTSWLHYEFAVRPTQVDADKAAALSCVALEGPTSLEWICATLLGTSAQLTECWNPDGSSETCQDLPLGQLPLGSWTRISVDIRADVSPMRVTAALNGTKLVDDVAMLAPAQGAGGSTHAIVGIYYGTWPASAWAVATDNVLFDMR